MTYQNYPKQGISLLYVLTDFILDRFQLLCNRQNEYITLIFNYNKNNISCKEIIIKNIPQSSTLISLMFFAGH